MTLPCKEHLVVTACSQLFCLCRCYQQKRHAVTAQQLKQLAVGGGQAYKHMGRCRDGCVAVVA